jgi:hypothetical protein
MNRFITDATRLASVRQRLVSAHLHPSRRGSVPTRDQIEEARLLGLLMADRAEVLG